MIDSAIRRDANRIPIQGLYSLIASKQRVFTGAAGLGAQGATTLFTVTGDVTVVLFGTCSEDLVGGAGLKVGTASSTATLVNLTATDIDANDAFQYNNVNIGQALYSDANIVANGEDIIETIDTADITDGTLTYYCFWYPLSSNGNVVAA